MTQLIDEVEYKKSNREKKLTARHGMHWCSNCDRDYIGAGSKCKACGHIDGRKRYKKE